MKDGLPVEKYYKKFIFSYIFEVFVDPSTLGKTCKSCLLEDEKSVKIFYKVRGNILI